MDMLSLAEIQKGQKVKLIKVEDPVLNARLVELGCVPGEVLKVSNQAPLGCPIAFQFGFSELSLRKEEALCVLVEPVS